jgi:O-antigen ligase
MIQTITNKFTGLSRWTTILSLGLFAVLPLERIPTLEYHDFTIKISYLVGLILLASWLCHKFKSKIHLSDWFLLAFWLVSLVSLLFAPNLGRSQIITLMWSFVFVLYFTLSRSLTQYNLYYRVEKVILVSTFLVCLFGLWQFIGDSLGLSTDLTGLRAMYTHVVLGYPRIQSVALEPLYFSNFLLVPLYLALKRSATTDRPWNKYWWLAVLILANIILGFARSAYIAVIVSLVILVIYLLWQKKLAQIASLVLAILLALLISYGGLVLATRQFNIRNVTRHAVAQDAQSSDSVGGRMATYRQAWQIFRQKPLVGHGAGSFGPLATPQNQSLNSYGIVNNEYLELLVETGAMGLLAFLGFLISLAVEASRACRRSEPNQKQTIFYLTLGLLAIFVQYNFFSTLYIIYLWAFLALLRSQTDNQ